MNQDSNTTIRAFLVRQTTLTDVVSSRIHAPRLPEGVSLPAVSFVTVGGLSNPYMAGIVEPLVEFKCWAASLLGARAVYRALYDVLNGIQEQLAYGFPYIFPIVFSRNSIRIMSAIEDVRGADLVDSGIQDVRGADLVDSGIQGYFAKTGKFRFMLEVAQ